MVTKRKSPIKHRVRAYKKENQHTVQSYVRGHGPKQLKLANPSFYILPLKNQPENELEQQLRKDIKNIMNTVVHKKVSEAIVNYSGFPKGTKIYYVRDWNDKIFACKHRSENENHSDKKYVIICPDGREDVVCRGCIHNWERFGSKEKFAIMVSKLYRADYMEQYGKQRTDAIKRMKEEFP